MNMIVGHTKRWSMSPWQLLLFWLGIGMPCIVHGCMSLSLKGMVHETLLTYCIFVLQYYFYLVV